MSAARHLRLVTDRPSDTSLPRTRGECEGGARPCPLISCRHHLAADLLPGGTLQVHWLPDEEPERPSCSLDVADFGGLGPTDVALIMGVSKQRVVQIEERVVRKLKKNRRAFPDYR